MAISEVVEALAFDEGDDDEGVDDATGVDERDDDEAVDDEVVDDAMGVDGAVDDGEVVDEAVDEPMEVDDAMVVYEGVDDAMVDDEEVVDEKSYSWMWTQLLNFIFKFFCLESNLQKIKGNVRRMYQDIVNSHIGTNRPIIKLGCILRDYHYFSIQTYTAKYLPNNTG